VPRFLLLLSPLRGGDHRPSAAEIQRRTMTYMDWVAAGVSTGVIVGGARLLDRATVVMRGDGVTTVSEPSRPADTPIGGYFVVEAENFASAVAIASGCPGAAPGSIEVRELEENSLPT
jgi:hypothetical protein